MASSQYRVAVVGSGYVGTTLAAGLAEVGHEVVAIDVDDTVVEAINRGDAPIHEPGLDELIARHAGDRLRATVDHDVIQSTDLTFIAVGTPSNADGSLDQSTLLAATHDVGAAITGMDDHHPVVIKSTVLPDTIERAVIPALETSAGTPVGDGYSVAVNPEFLREGSAVDDFFNPDKIVIGTEDDRAESILRDIFEPITATTDATVFTTGRREAAIIKYVNNAFLATKLSFINDIGNICKELDIDTYEVAEAIGLDHRIAPAYLQSGLGWGGSCLPKDTAALRHAASTLGYSPSVLEAAIEVNERQPERLLNLLTEHTSVAGNQIAVLGLAFKAGTDDIRNSRAIPVIEGLMNMEATVVAYDPNPGAVESMRTRIPDIEYVNSAREALDGAVGACVVTDWPAFETLDDEFDDMAKPVVIDGRRVITRREGLVYEGLTW